MAMSAGTPAFQILTPDDVPRPFGRDQNHVDILGWHNRLEMNGKPVRKKQSLARRQIGRDVLLVNPRLLGVGNGHKDDVGAPDGFPSADNLEAVRLGHGRRFAAFVKADDDVASAVLQIQCVGVALRAEAQDGQGLALEILQVCVFVGIYFCGHNFNCV
jgi:hypothetical protein